jgi:hypothetical protein
MSINSKHRNIKNNTLKHSKKKKRIGMGIVDTLISFLILEEMDSIFSIKCFVGYRFVIYSLYNVEIHSSYA